MTVHRTPAGLGIGMQTQVEYASVVIRGFGDTLTMAGLIAVMAALGTYYGGLAGGTQLAGYPTSAAGGLPALPQIIQVGPAYVRAAVKAGDEVTVATSLVTVLQTAGNTTTTGAQVHIPGPVI